MIDFLAILALALAIWKGWRKGLVMSLLSIAGYGLGIYCALRFRAVVTNWLSDTVSSGAQWLPLLAFFLILAVVITGMHFLGRMVEGVLNLAMLGWVNKLAGVIFYAVLYVILLSSLIWVVERAALLSPEAKAASYTYPALSSIPPHFASVYNKLF
ncbi:MAG: CvpA family protein [Bacteroidetes bacterium]|nr:CvpA family protein [Bacteroidota bacterium]